MKFDTAAIPTVCRRSRERPNDLASSTDPKARTTTNGRFVSGSMKSPENGQTIHSPTTSEFPGKLQCDPSGAYKLWAWSQ